VCTGGRALTDGLDRAEENHRAESSVAVDPEDARTHPLMLAPRGGADQLLLNQLGQDR
jgi:hypothetical protein